MIPTADVLRALVGLVITELILWIWRHGTKHDGTSWVRYDTRCLWCNAVHTIERAQPPESDEVPDGWRLSDDKTCRWCSLRCWVAHWRADPRVEAPPVVTASGMWTDDWPETLDD